jgi:hypothetical protein
MQARFGQSVDVNDNAVGCQLAAHLVHELQVRPVQPVCNSQQSGQLLDNELLALG